MLSSPSLRQWQYLVSLAENRHFGRAAEACFVTQSTLSAGIQELETQLGAALVDRTKRKVVLTPLGEDLAGRARELLARAEDMVLAARAASVPLSGPLRLGVIPTISPFLLPRVLPSLRKRFPDLRLFLREDLTARLVEQLQAGKLDLLLIALPYDGGALDTMTLFDDDFLVACREDHQLARRNSVKLDDLSEAPLLLLEDGHCLRDHALAACRLPPSPRRDGFAATSLHTLVQMVDSGLGVTLLPRLALDAGILRGTDVTTRPLQDGDAARHIGLAWRRGTQRAKEFSLFGEALVAALKQPGSSSTSSQSTKQKA
ncbi:hydrogen peroxide-inducible genes activator [Ferrovibrio sp.]|uniref:hydrogen peroxide-inducible genes activator n=1 Tax=Ferrovibrio sp. TaxID=1917215 RepID=UPI000CC3DCA8|nr:hydrogen peroxide-inducible genes activator [Ferrovibrio sp.]PJI43829.1 MAG: LysR family transcriptional regulator [Ferrovibrio sp.]